MTNRAATVVTEIRMVRAVPTAQDKETHEIYRKSEDSTMRRIDHK